MNEFQEKLAGLKRIDFRNAAVCFYAVRSSLSDGKMSYRIRRVIPEASLEEKFCGIVRKKLSLADNAADYRFCAGNMDNELMALPVRGTDAEIILEQLNHHPEAVRSADELAGSRFYIIRLTVPAGGETLYAFRRVSASWAAWRGNSLVNVFYSGRLLQDAGQDGIFRIDGEIDFFVYKDVIFVSCGKAFESAVNYRAGMERSCRRTIAELCSLGICGNAEKMREAVGGSMKLMRRLEQIRYAGYYKDPDYMRRARQVCETEKWGVDFSENGAIAVSRENIDTVLRILNNDRLVSPINAERFDADVKHKLPCP